MWLEGISLKPEGRTDFYYLLSPRQTGAFNCVFLNASHVRFARQRVHVPDQPLNTQFYDIGPVSLDDVITYGVSMRGEITRFKEAVEENTGQEQHTDQNLPTKYKWINQVRKLAVEEYKKAEKLGYGTDQESISEAVAKRCDGEILTDKSKVLTSGTIRRHALTPWDIPQLVLANQQK
jgi:hypothetical protein